MRFSSSRKLAYNGNLPEARACDSDFKIESIKENIDFRIHQGARYHTRLRLHRNLCQKLRTISLPNEYEKLLILMQNNQSTAVFLEFQKEIIRKKILSICENEFRLMGLSDFDSGN